MILEGKKIGPNEPVYFIAEAGSNFNQSLEIAKTLIEVAKDSGADAVKFQLFQAEELYPKDSPAYDAVKSVELNPDWIPKLKEHADKYEITFLASPFDKQSVDILENVGIAGYKVASSEIVKMDLLAYMARTKKPMFLSTGMCEITDVVSAIELCEENGNMDLAIMQCSAVYPLPMEQVDLNVLKTYSRMFDYSVGFSDHTLDNIASITSVGCGATVIEKHFTLNKKSEGPDHFYALEPDELKKIIQDVHSAKTALGQYKKRMHQDEKNYGRRLGIYTKKSYAKGDLINIDELEIRRPAVGIRAKYISALNGMFVRQNLEADQAISWDDIK